ncbi:hypothetical protein LOS25_14510 [Enterococcus faecium]|nr:hypothetical protein [Enterococcus faecium]
MKLIKLLLFNFFLFNRSLLYCGLLFSKLSILPSYQLYLMRILNIPAASMPLDIMEKLIRNPLFTTINLIVIVGISLVIYKKRG